MNHFDAVIIGAGAAGLAAAVELTKVNRNIMVLEARDRIGGRIHTIPGDRFSVPVEAGAEFIHGKLPATITLLKKAGIEYFSIKGKMWQIAKREVKKEPYFMEGWNLLMNQLKKLKEDQSIAAFLDTYFAEEKYRELKNSVLQYVQGYDAADAYKASAFALREEWENEDDSHQYRIRGGYGKLMEFLAAECISRLGTVQLSSVVTEINWKKKEVEVVTADQKRYNGRQVLITLPLGVLQADAPELGSLMFSPSLPQKIQAAKQMGFGAVIKINFQFISSFWEEAQQNRSLKNAGFIFSDAFVPTWWTQNPDNVSMLTGWLAGPKAEDLRNADDSFLFEKALESLSYIFKVDRSFIIKQLAAHRINNWTAEPFTRGAYAYATLQTKKAKKVLNDPVMETLYFAGEALFEGPQAGTVEGAIATGIEAARRMIADE